MYICRHEKKKLVYWAVSNCPTMSKRESYVKELQKYIQVDIIGRCGNMGSFCDKSNSTYRRNCMELLAKEYKFYLSFENAICNDYISEKLEAVLHKPVVPIVMGGGPYARYFPEGSYIDVFDFESPEHLAKYLLFLDSNKEEYLKYFDWKRDSYLRCVTRSRGACQLCAKLHDPTEPVKTYQNVSQWYIESEENKCQTIDSVTTFYSLANKKKLN